MDDDDFDEILAATRRFVRDVVVPRESEIADGDAVPADIRAQAMQMGLFGYAIPQRWGGLGLTVAQDVELAMELGYTALAVRSMFGTNNGIAGQVLVGFGTAEQQSRWLGPMAAGEVVASFALTEPGAGSNPSGLRTRAVRDGAGWVISGQKRWITNAPVADPRTRTPVNNTIIVAVVISILAGFVPLNYLADMVSIGTLVAFIVVSVAVIILRVREPDLPRGFKVPLYPLTPILSVLACGYILFSLPWYTWLAFSGWVFVVLVFYFAWGRHHSALNGGGAGVIGSPR